MFYFTITSKSLLKHQHSIRFVAITGYYRIKFILHEIYLTKTLSDNSINSFCSSTAWNITDLLMDYYFHCRDWRTTAGDVSWSQDWLSSSTVVVERTWCPVGTSRLQLFHCLRDSLQHHGVKDQNKRERERERESLFVKKNNKIIDVRERKL